MCWFNSGEKNMPYLEKQITEWRRQMLAAGIKSPVPLEELEGHLRDDIEEQMRQGIGAEAAFDVAVERLGRADVLKREFKQGRFDIRLVSPVFFRIYCVLCMPVMLSWMWALAEERPANYAGMVAVLLITLYIGGLPLFYRKLFTWQTRMLRVAMRVGYWFALIWTALALLSAFELIRLGNIVGIACWVAYAAYFATFLACANYEREHGSPQVASLAGS